MLKFGKLVLQNQFRDDSTLDLVRASRSLNKTLYNQVLCMIYSSILVLFKLVILLKINVRFRTCTEDKSMEKSLVYSLLGIYKSVLHCWCLQIKNSTHLI